MSSTEELKKKYLKNQRSIRVTDEGNISSGFFDSNPWNVNIEILTKSAFKIRESVEIPSLSAKQIYLWKPYYKMMLMYIHEEMRAKYVI